MTRMHSQFFSFSLVLALACGGSTPQVADPVDVTSSAQASLSAYDYMPANTYGVVRVDVARAMGSQYFPVLTGALDQLQGREAQVRDKGLEFARLVDVGYLSIGPDPDRSNRTEPGVAVLEGRFTLEQARDALLAIEPNETVARTQVGQFAAITVDDVILIDVGQGRFLFGPQARVPALAQNPPRPTFRTTNGNYASAEAGIDRSAIFSFALADAAIQREAQGELPPAVAEHMTAVGLSVDGVDGVQVRGISIVDDPAAAEALVQQANMMRDQVLGQPMLAAFNVADLIRSIQFTNDSTSARMSLDIPDSEVRRLLTLGMGMIGMVQMGSSPSVTSAPPP